jgi:hypothetical protein
MNSSSADCHEMTTGEGARIDGMCLLILKDKETSADVDYVFVAEVWCKDPRYKSRQMLAGQSRGLLRVDKKTLGAELLLPMAGDASGKNFNKAASKILKDFQASGQWPEKTQYAAG